MAMTSKQLKIIEFRYAAITGDEGTVKSILDERLLSVTDLGKGFLQQDNMFSVLLMVAKSNHEDLVAGLLEEYSAKIKEDVIELLMNSVEGFVNAPGEDGDFVIDVTARFTGHGIMINVTWKTLDEVKSVTLSQEELNKLIEAVVPLTDDTTTMQIYEKITAA